RQRAVHRDLKHGTSSAAPDDLAQLADKVEPGVEFPVKLAFNQAAPNVQVPGDALKLTGDQLLGLVSGLADAGAENGADAEDLGGFLNGEPLTDAQLKELAGLGLDEEMARTYNHAGLGFEDIKRIARKPSPAHA
ncbi:hypothetical protein ACFRMQ_31885, partial [Kitasatospora sp. NPDC056783]|uniref:hypothetical protein n=1 Tax=Kitasatospora sp. NPDC056783 TaxID=3345943 RepID=UPI00367DFACC